MENYYNLDGIRTALKKELEAKTELLKAWQAVTYPTKKNGEPFAIFSKNFDGLSISVKPYNNENQKTATVYTFATMSGYIHDEIDLWSSLHYSMINLMTEKPQNIVKCGCYSVYAYDLEDTKNAINKHIKQLQKQINGLNEQLANLENDYQTALTAYKNAMAIIDGLKDKYASNSGYYAIKETILNRYDYL